MSGASSNGGAARRAEPIVVSAEMGYGHLRAALPIAEALGTEVVHADRAPLADPDEQRLWARVRRVQELLSKPVQMASWLGDPTQLMDRVTNIPPLYARPDFSQPNLGAQVLDFLASRGLGRGLVRHLKETGAPLITTFYAPAIIADRAGCESVYCVATDADINRVWAPLEGRHSRVRYFAPSARVVRRLVSYGVPREHVTLTGFPLPLELLGNQELSVLRRTVARRIVRLDRRGVFRELHRDDLQRAFGPLPTHEEGQPPAITFAVGGAGAQAEMAFDFLPSLRAAIYSKHLTVNLVAGTRRDVAETFAQAIRKAGLDSAVGAGIRVLKAPDFSTYYRRFNELLLETDILWTKPSELSFYAALGLPIVLAKPVGSHERFNRRWLRELGVALKQDSVRHAAQWLEEWLEDGTYRILAAVRGDAASSAQRDATSGDDASLRGPSGQFPH